MKPKAKCLAVITMFVVALTIGLIGITEKKYSSPETGARRTLRLVHFPFWTQNGVVLFQKTVEEESAVEQFLLATYYDGKQPSRTWHLDYTKSRTLWGAVVAPHVMTAGPRVILYDNGTPGHLLHFLHAQQSVDHTFAQQLLDALSAPSTEAADNWRRKTQLDYYAWLLQPDGRQKAK